MTWLTLRVWWTHPNTKIALRLTSALLPAVLLYLALLVG